MKKAQVTVFIIIGLLLVIGVSIYLYLNERGRPGLAPSVLQAPVEIRPVAQYMTDCLTEAGKNGLVRIAAGGGHIDIAAEGARINPGDPTESDAVAFSPDSNLALPYWWYLKSPNECTGICEFDSQKPALFRGSSADLSIESQLDTYVAQSIKTCTANFTQLRQQGFSIIFDGEPTVQSTITASGVSFVLDYPIIITRTGQEFRYDKYGTYIEVPLAEMYEVATEITRLEADPRYNFLERHIKQVIDSFTGLQEGGLPPVAYATFDLDSGKRWIKVEVQREVRSLISTYVPMLQVWGTSNHVFLEAPADTPDPALWSRLYNLNMLIELQKNHPGLEIRFASPDWWREYFELNCRGQVCAADSFVNTFGFPFGFQKYNFAYDVSVPVLVEIRDKKAFGGEGYVFQYALEANIRSNEPFPVAGYNPNYPDKVFDESGPARSLLCEPEQRTGPEVTVTIVDSITGAPVDGAVSFDCGDESCAMGQTEKGNLVTRFPRCAGGVVNAITVNRFGHSVSINTNNDDTASVTLVSDQIKEFNAEFKRVQFVKADEEWRLDPAPTFAQKGDQFIVMLNREGEPDDVPFAGALESCTGAAQNDGASTRLVPGNYSVNVLVLYHEPLVFPPQRQCADDTGQYCFTIPEEPLFFGRPNADCTAASPGQPGPFLSGSSDYRWELTPQTFASGNTVIFKSLVAAIDKAAPEDRVIDDMDIVADLQDRSSAYTKLLTPEVVDR